MKTILLCILGIMEIAVSAQGQTRAEIDQFNREQQQAERYKQEQRDKEAREMQARKEAWDVLQMEHDFIPRNPWRDLNGNTNYIKTHGVGFCGKVVDITKDGVRIDGQFGELFRIGYDPKSNDNGDFFVANFPFTVVNDQIISENEHLMAWHVGTYTYSTVNGGSRTIRKLDYGISCDPPPELIQKQIEAAKAKAILDKKRAEQAQANAVKWLQPQATNGSASAQCSLGLHYLSGRGCETNREQAIYWLQKAATQGDLEASNALTRLQK
jgi:hypothetical protein